MRPDLPGSPRTGRFHRRLAITIALLLAFMVPAAFAMKPIPLDWKHTVGDPSILKTTKKYVVVATGAKVNRALSKDGKVWKWKSSALAAFPSWAKPNGGDVWAADIAKVGSTYLLYFAAPVRGKTVSSRCIGVATASKANAQFYPIPGPPLVCPNTFRRVPTAEDQIVDKAALDQYDADKAVAQRAYDDCLASLGDPSASPSPSPSTSTSPSSDPSATQSPTTRPTCSPTDVPPPSTAPAVIGAIDPSLFVDADHTPYLLYKTDGRPSSIRMLPLSGDGMHAAPDAISWQLVQYSGVLENPVMLHRGGQYYLFDSQGDYARCSYMTVWRSAPSIAGLTTAGAHRLLTRKSTKKLCGPGGADVLALPNKVLMYFEAWTCKKYRACHKSFWFFDRKDARKNPKRALYAVKLGFPGGVPVVKKFLKGKKR
jgi:arabinan endo-1,5-alpha-L-arabinosidase